MTISGTANARLDDVWPERRAKVEAILARRAASGDRAGKIADCEALAEEYRATGTIESAGDPIGVEAMLELRRFVARLRDCRKSEALSLATIADRSGIDMPALSRLDNGRGNPTFATFSRYVEALGLIPKLDSEVAGQR